MPAKTLTNLRSLSRWYATGDSSDTTFTDADTLLALNSRYQQAFLLATANDGEFELNGDSTQTISIASGVRAYTLATTLFKILGVEIQYPTTASNYEKAHQIDANSVGYYGKDNYTPLRPEFDLSGTTIEIFVSATTANIEAVTSGILVYYQVELTELSGPEDVIILPDVFERYICTGAASDYCGVNGLNTRLQWLNAEVLKAESKLTEFIANRNQAKDSRIGFRKEDYGQNSDEDGSNTTRDTIAF